MRTLTVILFLFFFSILSAQEVIPLVDFSGYFKSFKDGFFRQVEFQTIKEYKAGDDVVGYIDIRGNLKVYDGEKPVTLSNQNVEYVVSDYLLTWKIGPTLNMWDHGQKRTLTFNANKYWVRDSIVVYENTRYGSMNVYYKGNEYTLYTTIGDIDYPDFIGENIVAFRDNGNAYKVFWRGKIYDLDAMNDAIKFSAGTDILCFNDPMNGTFAIFENGQFLDLENFHMGEYKAGRGFIAYENQNGDLMYYSNGTRKRVSNFRADYWDVKDDVIVWGENGYTYGFYNGLKYEVARYKPEDYKIKNGVIAFRNIMGGVSAFIEGKVHEITNQMDADYEIYGNSVLVKLFNTSYIVFQNGKKYTI